MEPANKSPGRRGTYRHVLSFGHVVVYVKMVDRTIASQALPFRLLAGYLGQKAFLSRTSSLGDPAYPPNGWLS